MGTGAHILSGLFTLADDSIEGALQLEGGGNPSTANAEEPRTGEVCFKFVKWPCHLAILPTCHKGVCKLMVFIVFPAVAS